VLVPVSPVLSTLEPYLVVARNEFSVLVVRLEL
jgi:hypothetical protein